MQKTVSPQSTDNRGGRRETTFTHKTLAAGRISRHRETAFSHRALAVCDGTVSRRYSREVTAAGHNKVVFPLKHWV